MASNNICDGNIYNMLIKIFFCSNKCTWNIINEICEQFLHILGTGSINKMLKQIEYVLKLGYFIKLVIREIEMSNSSTHMFNFGYWLSLTFMNHKLIILVGLVYSFLEDITDHMTPGGLNHICERFVTQSHQLVFLIYEVYILWQWDRKIML